MKDFVWGMRDGKRNRPWIPEAQAEHPVKEGGLSVPCINNELVSFATKTGGSWTTSAGPLDLLLGDILWSCSTSRPAYLSSNRDERAPARICNTLWDTGAGGGGVVAAVEHAM